MKRTLLRAAAVVFACAALGGLDGVVGVTPVCAQDKPAAAPVTDAARDRARTAYRAGQSAFSAGRFEDAAAAFEHAFEAIPNPIVLLSVAQSRAKAGQAAAAIAVMKKYLELRTDAPDRADVERKIAALSTTPGILSASSDPPDADVEIDGSPMYRTPVQLTLRPGLHEIRCSRPGYQAHTQTLSVEPGSNQALHFQLDVLPAQPLAALPEHLESTSSGGGPPMTAIWITGGVGTAGLLTGAVAGVFAIRELRSFQDHPTTATADRGEHLALAADIGFGVGVVALATAAILYLTSDHSSCATSAAAVSRRSLARFELIPQVSRSSGGATLRARF